MALMAYGMMFQEYHVKNGSIVRTAWLFATFFLVAGYNSGLKATPINFGTYKMSTN